MLQYHILSLKQEGDRNYKRRFVKILEPLEQWVHKDSIILTDFTVDKSTLHNMGFSSVYQVSISEAPTPQNKYSNQNVMDYLRRIVPRMFQVCYALFSVMINCSDWVFNACFHDLHYNSLTYTQISSNKISVLFCVTGLCHILFKKCFSFSGLLSTGFVQIALNGMLV